MIPCETIDLHQGAADSEGEIVESIASVGGPVVANVGRGVEANTGQADSVKECRLDPVLPGPGGVCGLVLLQPGLDLPTGLVDRHPVQVRPGTGRGGRRVGNLVSGGLHHVDLGDTDTQGLGCHLDHLGVQALPHLSPCQQQQHEKLTRVTKPKSLSVLILFIFVFLLLFLDFGLNVID